MLGKRQPAAVSALIVTVLPALMLIAAPADAQTETVLYNFCSQPNCTGGDRPYSGLIMDKMPSHSVTTEGAASVDQAVRAFMQTVSRSVTQDGPMAWIKYFDASPAFFMAVNGQMAFPNPAAAQEGTRKFANTIRHIELNWGDDLRVDPLNNEFAVVAVSWREIQVDTAGHSVTETGYFTGLTEHREGRWQFRDAHWSSPASSH